MKKQKGFTLIELMVVMAIIAILATAGLTAYSSYLKKARDASRALVARQIMTAVESLANGGNIPSSADLNTYLTNEGFSYTLPTMNPLIARVSGVVDNILGTSFALPKLDSLKTGETQCINSAGAQGMPCIFVYLKFSNNTYLIGYGIEHQDSQDKFLWWNVGYGLCANLTNMTGTDPWDIFIAAGIDGISGTGGWYGNFIGTGTTGTSPYPCNPGEVLQDTTALSDYSAIIPSP